MHKRTVAVSVGELDPGDVQWFSQVDRPPRVRRSTGMCTGSIVEVRVVVAVISVIWKIQPPVSTDLV